MEDEALEEFQGIDQTNPNAVVIGLAPSKFNYEKVCYYVTAVSHKTHLLLVKRSVPFVILQ